MDIAILIITFITWAAVFYFCVFVTISGLNILRNPDTKVTPVEMEASRGNVTFKLKSCAAVVMILAGIAGAVYVTYSYWYVLLTLLVLGLSFLMGGAGGYSGDEAIEKDKKADGKR